MEYLKPDEYYSLIGEIIGKDRETAKELLLNKFRIYREANPRFIHFVNSTILNIQSIIEIQTAEFVKQWLLDNPEKNFEDAPPKKSFWFNNGHLKVSINKKMIQNLIEGFKDFEEETNKSKHPIEILPEKNRVIKLKWTGNKNQLYSVIRQLKNDYELITNSYNELADFLIANVTGFENTKKETVEKEIKKDQPLPKERRVNIKPEE
jgi:hypothetical protein